MSITEAVIPVAGLGTRLLPATRSQPKEMLPVVDKPVVQYVVEELVRSGVERVLFVTGRRKRAIEDHFDANPELDQALGDGAPDDPRGGVHVFYTRQLQPAGLGDALRYAEGFAASEAVVVALGDTIVEPAASPAPGIVSRLIEAYEHHGASAAIAVEQVPSDAVSRYGIVIPADDSAVSDPAFDVADVIEKPSPREVESRLAVAARYVLGRQVFAALRDVPPDASGEVQLADALRKVVNDGGRVLALPLTGGERRHDIGTIESYCSVFLEHALKDPQLGPGLRARAAALIDDAR
jgi:UTP--glucose-1-phosphate uridylyltransferase